MKLLQDILAEFGKASTAHCKVKPLKAKKENRSAENYISLFFFKEKKLPYLCD